MSYGHLAGIAGSDEAAENTEHQSLLKVPEETMVDKQVDMVKQL